MAKINIFGKTIDVEYDIGVVYADGKPVPKATITPGDDLSVEMRANLADFAKQTTNANEITDVKEFSPDFQKDGSYSNPELSLGVPAHPVVPPLHKGRGANNSLPDGNKLLSGVTAPADTQIVPKFTSPILARNRFTADNKRNAATDFRINPDHPETSLGSYQEYRNSTNGKDFSDGHFAHIGASLTLRATQELLASSRTGYGPDGPDGAGATLASILPGLTQAGASKVNVSDLEVKDVLNQIIAANTTVANLDPSSPLANHQVLSINNTSFGQMNNVLEPFSGLLPLGMLGLSAALVLVLKIALKAILVIFTTITSAGSAKIRRTDDIGRYFKGKYNDVQIDDPGMIPIPLPASLFGLRETSHPYADAIDEGIKQFFGGDIGDSLTQILAAPGFYAVFCRSVVRSAEQIVEATKAAIKGNPIQIAENIIALVDIIKSSKIVAAMNMFATIGDASLNLADLPASKDADPTQKAAQRLSTIDALPDEASSGYKNRLRGQLKLAWSNSSAPSAFVMPQGFLKSLSVMGQVASSDFNELSPLALKNEATMEQASKTGNRLDSEFVKTVEAKLDAEYMPFYFHDLRTNEIISFPAFLTSLGDDFTVNYETSDYYGRVDQVKIYKSTHRKISLGFIIAATGPDDFDQMWFKINKLVTMVYPQWTQGTILNNADESVKITQPFSQIPGASPLIRLRLGDLFRSNYSRFALARLFGIGGKQTFSIKGLSEITTDESYISELQKSSDLIRDPSKAQKGFKFLLETGTYFEAEEPSGGLLAAIAAAAGAGSAKPKLQHNIPHPVVCTVKANNGATLIVDVENKADLGVDKMLEVSTQKVHASPDFFEANLKSVLAGKHYATLTSDQISKVKAFFSPDNNSIVRSFESVGGKGLACQIDSLNFGWLDNIPWETAIYGSRAPKMCRITMNLTPTHDIAPGLDSDGFNRAPLYNVGGAIRGFGGDANDTDGLGQNSFKTSISALASKLRR